MIKTVACTPLLAFSLWLAAGFAQAGDAESVNPASTVTPFEATYKATYNGSVFEDKVFRRLERLPDGTYRHSYSADHLLYFLHEESVLDMQGCEVKPRRYSSRRGNFISKREESVDFLWDSQRARYVGKKGSGEFTLQAGTLDPMSVFLRIACQVSGELGVLTYPEVDGDHIETREYRTLGLETLDTPNGKVETVRIEKVHKNKKRRTYLWLMANNPVLVVRARQNDTDGSTYELDLSQWKPISAK